MLALLCGGQGSLSPAIFDLVADEPAAGPILAQARYYLGSDPRDFVRTSNADQLSGNRVSQILTVTATLAVHACVAKAIPKPVAVTGYSVGEMAAWSIAGIWSADEALRLTDVRARAMEAAGGSNGRLGYVRGLSASNVEKIAERRGCSIAITNPGNLFVVGGAEAGVVALCRDALAEGAARAELLSVRIASHTNQLKDACAPFHRALLASNFAGVPPDHILLAGGDGSRVFSVTSAMGGLAAQIAAPVDWSATLQSVVETGVDRALDLGPGHPLADMMRTVAPEIATYSADAFHAAGGVIDWIHSARLDNR